MITDTAIFPPQVCGNLPLSKQVELMATMLKREDYNQVVLIKTKVENALAILTVADMLKEEGIEYLSKALQSNTTLTVLSCLELDKNIY